jgi:hypothetical protein
MKSGSPAREGNRASEGAAFRDPIEHKITYEITAVFFQAA